MSCYARSFQRTDLNRIWGVVPVLKSCSNPITKHSSQPGHKYHCWIEGFRRSTYKAANRTRGKWPAESTSQFVIIVVNRDATLCNVCLRLPCRLSIRWQFPTTDRSVRLDAQSRLCQLNPVFIIILPSLCFVLLQVDSEHTRCRGTTITGSTRIPTFYRAQVRSLPLP